MECPHCQGPITLAPGDEPEPATPADVDIARINAERDVRLALIANGHNPDDPADPLPVDTSHAEVYAEAEVEVAVAEADAEVAAAEVMGAAIEGAAEVVAASVEAAAEITSGDDDDIDGELSDDAEVIVTTTEQDETPARGSLASRLWG